MDEGKVNVTIDNLEIKSSPESVNTDTRCDCCGKIVEHTSVLCSNLVAMSFAYCDDCIKKDLEPYDVLVSYFAGIEWDDIFPHWQNIIRESCKLNCKTIEQFRQDCIDFIKGYRQ